MNQNTRPMYDETTTRNRNVLTQQQLKYVVHPMTDYRRSQGAHSESIDAGSNLRMKPTRLNYNDRPETELYGTAPFKGLGHRNVVDTESMLRNGNDVQVCNRVLSERLWDTNDFISDTLAVDSVVRPTSTRANLRNSYANVSHRAVDANTHHT